MESKKRERAANFTSAEVQILIKLVEKNKHIIENKKTDAVTNRDKEFAWKKIESSFNSCGISTTPRSWKTLKLKYEGIKKITKKKSSLQRQETYRTGGGPSKAPVLNDIEEKVLSICSNINGLDARNDSDSIIATPSTSNANGTSIENNFYICEMDDSFISQVKDAEEDAQKDLNETFCELDRDEIIVDTQKDLDETLIPEMEDVSDTTQNESKWKKWNPAALKSNLSSALKVNKASVTRKLDQLSAARLELVKLQIDIAKEQHQFAKAEHDLKIIQLENEDRRRQEMHEILIKKITLQSDEHFIKK